jgi:hypothetical protein
MITKNISAIYRWLMVDSTDMTIKGDYEAISTGYEQYVAKEVHNTQLINFLQVIGQFPEIKQYLKQEAFTRPLLRAFNMEPDKVVKTEEEVTKEMQAQQEAQQKQIEAQAQAAQQAEAQKLQQETQSKAQLAQQQGQIMQAQTQAQMQSSIAVEQNKALLDEKQSVSEDQRELEIKERLELIKQGNVLHPSNLENYSVILREEKMREQSQLTRIQSEQDKETEQEELRQVIEQEQIQEQQAQQQAAQAQGGIPPQEGMAPQGQMPEDPTQAGPAQERLQGGPSAQDIQRREFAENAPQ